MAVLSSEQEQTLAIFNHAGEEIHFFKSQQWHVTNYALLSYAALAAAPLWMNTWQAIASSICIVLVIVAAGLALWVLRSLEAALGKERCRMEKARRKLPLIAEIHANGRLDHKVIWALRAAVVVGAGLAITINLARVP